MDSGPYPAFDPVDREARDKMVEIERRLERIELELRSRRLPQGCICPPGAEVGCGALSCPRRPFTLHK
jgi:hypothetical protein